MRQITHWTPHYIKNRLITFFYQKNLPQLPWLTQDANAFLENYIAPTDIMLEYGSGRSSIWFSKKVLKLYSVEHNKQWFNKTKKSIEDLNINNIEYLFASNTEDPDNYVSPFNKIESESIDIVLVDGIHREPCTLNAIKRLKPGGFLAIDNVERYLPHNSYSPEATRSTYPLNRQCKKCSPLATSS